MLSAAAAGSLQERDEEQEDEGEEELRDGGLPFYVNRGGLPVDDETWERMWRQVARIHPSGDALGRDIRRATDLPKVKRTGGQRCVPHVVHKQFGAQLCSVKASSLEYGPCATKFTSQR